MSAVPGVRQVTEEEPVELFMDTAAERMELPGAWSDPRVGGRADAGKGIRVGIIDAGVAGDHPMFDDTGFQAPPGFPKATRRVGDQVDDLSAGAETMVNNKVIVSRVYVNPEIARQPGGDQITPYPGNTHGTHVAGIAAGNVVQGGPNEMGWGELAFSGVAPGAYLMALHGLRALYGSETPVRGDVEVFMHGAPGSGVTGVIASVVQLVTGAAGETGFPGAGSLGLFARKNLLTFGADVDGVLGMRRRDTGKAVTVHHDLSLIHI